MPLPRRAPRADARSSFRTWQKCVTVVTGLQVADFVVNAPHAAIILQMYIFGPEISQSFRPYVTAGRPQTAAKANSNELL